MNEIHLKRDNAALVEILSKVDTHELLWHDMPDCNSHDIGVGFAGLMVPMGTFAHEVRMQQFGVPNKDELRKCLIQIAASSLTLLNDLHSDLIRLECIGMPDGKEEWEGEDR